MSTLGPKDIAALHRESITPERVRQFKKEHLNSPYPADDGSTPIPRLARWLQETDRGQSWFRLYNGRMQVYIRVGAMPLPDRQINKTVQIANVEVREDCQDQGLFTKFLTEVEEVCDSNDLTLMMENVMTERFANFFRGRGWHEVQRGIDFPSFWRM